MFDLGKKIPAAKVAPPVNQDTRSDLGCALVYQSTECKSLVEELFAFEGWDAPVPASFSSISPTFFKDHSEDLILLELSESNDVVADAREFAAKLPTHKGVIIIGKEDAISTLRTLKEMGFYYLFWPINKYEFADFVRHVHSDLKAQIGISKERRAKRVSIVGTKGGIGTSFITAELSAKLAGQGVDTVLVDHQFHDSNMDVLLGLTEHLPRSIDELAVPEGDLDLEGAQNFLSKVAPDLRFLSINGELADNELLSYNHALCKQISRNTNFIVADFSGSVDFRVTAKMLVTHYDVVVIVIEPSVSAIRNAKALISSIDEQRQAQRKRTRIISVVNHHRPESSFVVQRSELEKFLGSTVDIDIDYCKQLSHFHIKGKKAYKQNRHVNRSVEKLANLVNGQPITNNVSILQRLGIR